MKKFLYDNLVWWAIHVCFFGLAAVSAAKHDLVGFVIAFSVGAYGSYAYGMIRYVSGRMFEYELRDQLDRLEPPSETPDGPDR